MKRFALLLIFALGCRSVIPVREIRTASAPDISRVTLKNGKVVTFNEDFGWYDKKAGVVEGTIKSIDGVPDSQHVAYHLMEINKVETVRGYAIFGAIGAALVIGAIAIYFLFRLVSLL